MMTSVTSGLHFSFCSTFAASLQLLDWLITGGETHFDQPEQTMTGKPIPNPGVLPYTRACSLSASSREMPMRLLIVPALILTALALLVRAQDDLPPDVFLIQPGSVEGSISESFTSQRYAFQAEAGQPVQIRMERTSGNLDAYLLLFDANETFLVDNDDFAEGSRDAQIQFTPEVSGTYIVEATRFSTTGEVGQTTGTYRLTLEFPMEADPAGEDNPLNTSPQFGVDFGFIEYEDFGTGTLDEEQNRQYFALGGTQGQFLRLVLTTTSGDLDAKLNVLNSSLTVLSRVAETTETTQTVYAALPQTGWYLLEVTRQTGTGDFSLYPTLVSDAVLADDAPLEGLFDPATQTLSYVFNATINERVFINMTVLEGDGVQPELTILDLSQEELVQRSSTGTQTRATLTIPRSGPYVVQARNVGDANAEGRFQLQLRRSEADIGKLRVEPAAYNESYQGEITEGNPIDYYRFSGKAGELVTIEMQPLDEDSALDPYIILADSGLNELAFNDNAGASSAARVAQFALPADGEYFILATRAGLSRGMTAGAYDLDFSVGQIALESGSLSATLEWAGTADLNLFVRDPSGRIVSWANPATDSAVLQIDSNTGCETPTAQPVEHVYWTQPPQTGEYTVWVWYQNICTRGEPIAFDLQVEVGGEIIVDTSGTGGQVLIPGERYETSVLVQADGDALLANRGSITSPSQQQRASQGGDILIVYEQTLVGTISDEVWAQFYQFQGGAGDTITITVERITGNLDPVLVLRNSNDVNLTTNDDAEEGQFNLSQITYTLPEDGRYVIAVTRFGIRDGVTVGDYRLTLEQE